MKNILLVAILVLIIGSIIFYLIRQKKQGQTCIGCPYAKECSKKSNTCKECKH